MIVSPQIWREVLKPLYKEMVDTAHENGLHMLLHTCGNVKEIIPDIIEINIDALHPIQPGCMNAKEICSSFRGKISFFGGIDVQDMLPNARPDQIHQAMKEMIEIFDGKDGGFISAPANSIMPETPLENIFALFEAIEKYSDRRM
jgi:uroporphyrinogen decarboxylase